MAETKLAHNHKDLEQLRKECKEKYNDLEVIEYKHEIIGKQIRKYVLVSNGKQEKMEFKILVGDRLEPWSVAYNIPAGVIRDGKMQNCCL